MVGRALVVMLAGLLASSAVAAPAARCARPTDDWTIVRGDLAPGSECGTFVASTDASDTRYTIGGTYRHVSLARFAWREPVKVPFEMTLDWQWLTAGRWGLEIDALGIVVMLGVDSIGFYINDSQMMGSLFEDIPHWSSEGMRHVTIRRTEREIVVSVDGKIVGRKVLDGAPSSGTLILGLRGAPIERTKGALRSVQVRQLTSR